GNIINNGYVLRDPSNYYNEIDVKGNIENNGIWKPYKTTLSGVNMQFLQQSAGKQFEGVWAITDTNSYVQLMSEVKFFNADVNFGYDTLHTNSYKFEISNSDFYNASIITSDTITINNKNFSLKNVNFIGNAILKGSTYYSNNIVFENDLTILDTLMDRAGSFVITVKGSLNILGSFIRHPSNYYPDLYAYGNILLNGNFTVFQTYLVGKNTRTINGNFASSSTSKFIVDDSVSLHGNNIIPILSVSAKPEATLTILPQGFLELSSGISESKVFNYGKITSIQEIDTTTESNFNLYYASFRNYKNRFVNKLLIDHFGNQQHPTVSGSVNGWWRLRNNPQLFNDSLKYLKLRYTNQILNGNIPDSLQVYYSSNAGVKWNKITNNVLIDTATKTVTINNAPSAGHYVLSSTSLGILNFTQKLEHAEPRSGGNSGIVTMYIFGAGFKSSSVAKLTRSGYADITADTTYITDLTGESMLARFNLKNAELGKWDIVVNTPNDTTVSLPQYFTIEPGTRSNPWMTISGRDKFLLNRWQTFTISYGNTANTDAKGTVMVLTMNDIPGLEVAFPDINFVMPKGVLEENPWYKQIIDSVPLYYITDTLSEHLGERMRVYPFYLPYINAGSTNSVRVRVKLTGTGDLNFNAWIQDPWFESIAQLGKTSGPMPMEVRACITAAAMKYYATNLVSMIPIPGFGCFNLVDKIADPIGYITPESIKPEEVKPNTWGSSLWNMVSWAGSITQCATSIIPGVGAAINIGVGLTTMLIDSKDNYDTHQACWNKFKKDKKNKLKSKGVNSFDPNEIVGPQGYTELNYINKNSSLDYTVYFENKSTAGAAALEVFVFDTLDKTKFDLSTFSFGNISFGDTSVSVQNFAKEFSMLVDLSPKKDVIVNIQGKLDTATGIVTWSFHSLDRITLDLTEDPELGFLPPNVVSPQGEGNVKYTCALFQDVLHNVSVANQATIIFDFNAPITTNTHIATIDDREPISKVNTLNTVQEDSIFTVNWSGTDEGSGIAYYTIFVSENDSAFKVWKATTSLTSALFTGKDNAKYKFYCVATDSVGHVENKYNLTEATTTVKVVHSSVSSVSSNDKGFKLYPNPADNKVYVVMHLTENTSIDAYITDITGKTIQLIQGFNGLKGLNELTFNTEEFKKGIYFITIKTPQYSRTQKLIILK
ncbi:MAG: T9SS type A sorting domain-containing protein, partial [Bacteroidia bacterium]|nr:T9SS type A sorting domain-containing protein [Bacteroidia bacterium]